MDLETEKVMAVTYFGASLGRGYYFLISAESVFALSIRDAVRAQENGAKWVPNSLLTDLERSRVFSAWESAHVVLGY